jgi:sulfur-oxidizing protein SoxZ
MKSRLGKTRLCVPGTVRRDEFIEIRTMAQRFMESGIRYNNVGMLIPRHIATGFVCTYNGREVFRADLYPAVSTNPYFLFYVVADESGEFVFSWADDRGGVVTETRTIVVS